ncbi:tetratricopeptide repeat protein [filamentous cyanobacterium LEGE 11480]|uniref:non-specific serine/threonine protein kinase n=1 Tax=Romeriopsis navalis LEGE 11480 TaxID=2777977 RepID=A0A928VS78_9CYAN|nr:serine/threonine-protein kinase [Romeriopsis navalis]MBE9031229.1 tetratricopeptide repeat protein [Romeriopsis navalis LEGE 11480]
MERICINPACGAIVSDAVCADCPECGTELLYGGRFILRRALREVTPMQGIAVYEADDRQQAQACILKVLLYPQAPYLRHFEQEAALLANLSHPGLPQVDIDDGGYFTVTTTAKQYPRLDCFAMEKIAGITLAAWLSRGETLLQAQAIDWLEQLSGILSALHQEQIFHRDIKPSNIMLQPDGRLVLIDFGSVRAVTDTYLNKLGEKRSRFDGVTIFNSAGYTPYEQTQGRAVMQSDFFALAHTFIHLLTGIHPMHLEPDDRGVIQWRSHSPQVSAPFADLLDQMGALMPHDRPANIAAIQAAIAKLPAQIKADRWRRSPWLKVAKGVGIAILVGGLLKGTAWYLSTRYLKSGLQMALEGNYREAQGQLESALMYDLNNPALHSNLATICQQQRTEAGDKCAIQHYQRAILLNPSNSVTRYNFASFYGDIGEFVQAEAQYKRLLEDTPGFVDARNNLARLYLLEGQYKAAEGALNLASTQVQDDLSKSAILKNVGWLRYEQKQYGAAIKALNAAIKLAPEARTDAYCLLAKALDSQSDQGESTEAWQRCLSGDTTAPEVKQWQGEKLNQVLPVKGNPN